MRQRQIGRWLQGAAFGRVLLSILFLLLAGSARAEIVDRIVARVASEIITRSDVETLRRYQELLAEPGAPAPGPEASGRRVLDALIEQQLILAEASTLTYTPMSAEAVDGELAWLAERLGSRQALERRMSEVGLSEEELRGVIERQGNILRFLDARFRASVELGEEDLARYYREQLLPEMHRRGAREMPAFEDVEDQIRELLTQQRISALVSGWLVDLKARTRIQLLSEP